MQAISIPIVFFFDNYLFVQDLAKKSNNNIYWFCIFYRDDMANSFHYMD